MVLGSIVPNVQDSVTEVIPFSDLNGVALCLGPLGMTLSISWRPRTYSNIPSGEWDGTKDDLEVEVAGYYPGDIFEGKYFCLNPNGPHDHDRHSDQVLAWRSLEEVLDFAQQLVHESHHRYRYMKNTGEVGPRYWT
jgi:hypothetical protein